MNNFHNFPNLSRSELSVIKGFVSSSTGSLHLYTAFQRTLLSPAELAKTIRKLQNLGLVSISEDVISLTPEGFKILIQLSAATPGKAGPTDAERQHPSIPANFMQAPLPINSAYVPKWTELPPSLRKKVLLRQTRMG